MKFDKTENREYEFHAFISYKHGGEDEKWTRWLQRKLESYRIPVADLPGDEKSGNAFPRRLRVFRDKSDLGSHAKLERGLSENLDASRYLIVVCSRRSAESPYVDAEVCHFVEMGREGNVIPFVIEEPGLNSLPYPPSLPPGTPCVDLSVPLEGSAPDREEAFIHLLSRLLRVDRENLWQAHLRASMRQTACRLSLAAITLTLLTTLVLWAVSAERRATERRLVAEEVVNFLTFDLIREASPYIPARTRASITEKVREYYEKWAPHELAATYAKAVNLGQRGSVATFVDGDTPGAFVLQSQARELFERLHRSAPHNESYFSSYTDAIIEMGSLLEIRGESERAADSYRESLNIAMAFSEAFPDSLRGHEKVAGGLEHLAKAVLSQGKPEEANVLYRQCGEVWEKISRAWPKETQTWLYRMKLGDFYSGYAFIHVIQNNFAESMACAGKAIRIFRRLHEEDPKNLAVRLFYAEELAMVTFLEAKTGALTSADVHFSLGEELWRSLVAEDPQYTHVFGWAKMLTNGALLRIEQAKFLSEADVFLSGACRDDARALLDESEELTGALLRILPENDAFLSHKSLIEEYRERIEEKNEIM
ncbi:MAG: toll/interleukin-1 receptor domain-containing protein [Synergistaceae bacterium]|jgi:tetratricopeptide (TPR) repeat protein|nr:toll/interleukin-1 receptor domain-containing protein [Synergistaceae bacterium]